MFRKNLISYSALLLLILVPMLLLLQPVNIEHGVLKLCINENNQVLAIIFAVMAFILVLQSMTNIKLVEVIGALLYANAGILVLLSGNLFTMLLAWEALALSAILILASGSHNIGPVLRYAVIHFIGGTCILIAISCNLSELKEPIESSLQFFDNFSTSLLATGILINCAAFPFSTWVTDSYPAASPHATAILQIYVTKSAAFMLFIVFPKHEILVLIGMITAIYALIYSVWQKRLRVILTYNTVGQMGLIITGIGFGAHVVPYLIASIVYQTVLYMVVSAVIHATGKEKLQDLGGLFKKMPVMAGCSIIALLTMAALPLTVSFNAKLLVSHAITSPILLVLFILINVGFIVSCGMRIIYCTFFSMKKHDWSSFSPISKLTSITTAFATMLCIVPIIDVPSAYSIFTIFEQIMLFIFSAIIFYFLRSYTIQRTVPDVDYLYRVLILKLLYRAELIILSSWQKTINALSFVLKVMLQGFDSIKVNSVPYTILLAMVFIAVLVFFKFMVGYYA